MLGFITGTFDLLHPDHLRLLSKCKQNCDYLIVGLVSDRLALAQKRECSFNFEHRKQLLESLRYVDEVVVHDGGSKQDAYKKLCFTILFSSEEYRYSVEHTTFERDFPNVKTMYFKKGTSTSTTNLLADIETKVTHTFRRLADGCSSTLYRIGKTVIKDLNISAREIQHTTRDVYECYRRFGCVPRNYKGTHQTHVFPMIPGLNMYREIIAMQRIQSEPWCTYLFHHIQHKTQRVPIDIPDTCTIDEIASIMHIERSKPHGNIVIHMRDGGETLESYARKENINSVSVALVALRGIVHRLNNVYGIKHNDIHPNNVLVSSTGEVSIIDFGWCTCDSFDMCDIERKSHEDASDWDHFVRSLNEDPNLISYYEFAKLLF